MLKNIFSKSFFGIDDSGELVKFVEVLKNGKSIKIGRFGCGVLPENIKKKGNYPVSINQEGQVLANVLINKVDDENYLIIEINKVRTYMHFVVNGKSVSSITLDIGESEIVQGIEWLSKFRDEVQRQFIYWHTNKYADNTERPKIKKIILCGDGAKVPNIAEYLSVGIRQKVELANIWTNFNLPHGHIPEMSFIDSLGYAKAVGLALSK
ncbi:pilus assembly protein PilM [Candidatus Nomurabacteria bacterium]|nr:pilus assembly protein PilM [Candidatus Nomurabacteria bacterium]